MRVGQLVTTAGEPLDSDRPTYMYSWIDATDMLPFVLSAGTRLAATGEVSDQ